MLLFFASNAVHAPDLMPPWLRAIAPINPLTYLVDPLRGFTIVGGESVHGYALDFSVLFTVFITLLIVAVRLYPTLADKLLWLRWKRRWRISLPRACLHRS